jgi:uncharacterized protein YfbU (UPF0304 family)
VIPGRKLVAMKLSDGEKLILSMLCDIHEHLKIDNGTAGLVSSAIYRGNLWGLKWVFPGIFHDSEPTEEMLHETVNIMDMWSFIERFYEKLSPEEKTFVEKQAEPFGKHVRFDGFDGNGEAAYISIARFLVDKLDRFQDFKGREMNAHMPTLEAHRRMLAVYTPMRNTNLTAQQIANLIRERTHPENRKAARA